MSYNRMMKGERQSTAEALGATDGEKAELHIEELDDSNMKYLTGTKAVCGILALLSGAFLVIALLVSQSFKDNFDLTLRVNRSLRNGAVADVDGYPVITSDAFGFARVALVGGFTGVLGAVGFLIAALARNLEWEQMRGNSNPYMWIFFLIWNVPYFLVISLTSGVPDVIVLTLLGAVVVAWIFLFWMDDLQTSYGNQLMALRCAEKGESLFGWVPVVMILFLAITAIAIIFTHLIATFNSAGAPSAILLTVPIVLTLLYLANPIVYILHRYRTGIKSIYTRDLILYAVNGLLILLAVWLPFAVHSGDGITPFHPSSAPIIAGVANANQGFQQTSSAAHTEPLAALATTAALALAARA